MQTGENNKLACIYKCHIPICMFDNLLKTLQNISEIPPSEWLQLLKFLKVKKIKKDEFLFMQGDESEIIAYVSSGFVYSFYTSYKDEIRVKKFCWEGRFTSPYVSFLNGSKSCYFSCKALEDSTLFYINYSDLLELYKRHHCWQKVGRLIAEKSIIERETREYETLCFSLSQRYNKFVEQHKNIIDRVPQYLIASYLGITPVSLSRLRSELNHHSE